VPYVILIASHAVLQESGLTMDMEQKKPFLELHYIMEALERRDLEPALRFGADAVF
jgi:hypothetical protein